MPTEYKYATAYSAGSVSDASNATGEPDTLWTTNTGNTDWSARWAMEDPSGPLTGTQTIDVLVRTSSSSGSGTPTVTVTLYELTTSVSLLHSGTINSTTYGTGVYVGGTFDASAITTPANVQIQVGASGHGGGPNAQTVQVEHIRWTVSYDVAGTPQSVPGGATATPSIGRTVGKTVTASATSTPTIGRGVAAIRQAVAFAAGGELGIGGGMVRAVTPGAITGSVLGTPTLNTRRFKGLLLSHTVTGAGSVARGVAAIRQATATSTPTFGKATTAAMTGAASAAATTRKAATTVVTGAASAAGSAARAVARLITGQATVTGSVDAPPPAQGTTFYQTLTARFVGRS